MEIKNCPFCGGKPDGPHLVEYIGDSYTPYYWIECDTCPAYMEHDGSMSALIYMWNSRTETNNQALSDLINQHRVYGR